MKSRGQSQRIELTYQVDGQTSFFIVKDLNGQPIEYLPNSLEVEVNGVDQGEPGTNFVEGQGLTSFTFSAFMIRPPSRLVAYYVPKYGWHRYA